MSSNKIHGAELHKQITDWKKEIDSVRDEIRIYKKELEEIASKNNRPAVMAQVEQFQNQFIRHLEVSDELYHQLKEADHLLAIKLGDNPAAMHVLVEKDANLYDQMESYTRLFQLLKEDYRRFLAEWM
ncbi:MAG: hypothetical protein SFW35_07815 [Chitinophagales bacterium]|nr:hypothetical protein [Chitinophagales bacterium]